MSKIFVSDFDGTATKLDFYKIVLNRIGEAGWSYVEEYRKTGKVDYHFLNHIFGWERLTDADYAELIDTIELDETLRGFLDYLKIRGIDFKFVSAGFDKYIEDVLKKDHYQDVTVITNPGVFEDGILKMMPDPKSDTYHELFGIDKGEVIRQLRKDYDVIYFAGDTEPDLSAAMAADIVFAKGELIPFLEANHKKYIEFDTFEDIVQHMEAGRS